MAFDTTSHYNGIHAHIQNAWTSQCKVTCLGKGVDTTMHSDGVDPILGSSLKRKKGGEGGGSQNAGLHGGSVSVPLEAQKKRRGSKREGSG